MDFPTAWGRSRTMRVTRDVIQSVIVSPLFHYLGQLEVRGSHYLVGDGPFIIAANHVSTLDTPVVLSSLPSRIRRRTVVAAAIDTFFAKRLTATTSVFMWNAIPIDRHKINRRSADDALALLNDHWTLLIYPEGGRTPDGAMHDFKGGAAYLADRSHVQVIPTYIHDVGFLLGPRFAKAPLYTKAGMKWRHRVVVAFGPPLEMREGESLRRFGQRIESAVVELGRSVSGDENYGPSPTTPA